MRELLEAAPQEQDEREHVLCGGLGRGNGCLSSKVLYTLSLSHVLRNAILSLPLLIYFRATPADPSFTTTTAITSSWESFRGERAVRGRTSRESIQKCSVRYNSKCKLVAFSAFFSALSFSAAELWYNSYMKGSTFCYPKNVKV